MNPPAETVCSRSPEFTNVVSRPPTITSVIHVTSWLSREGGGIPPVIWNLTRQFQQSGIECSVAGLADQWGRRDIPDSIQAVTGAIKGPVALGFSPELSAQLEKLIRRGSVVHIHGLWMQPGLNARQCAVRNHSPLMISPHGMLEPWALRNSRWKKKLAGWLQPIR